MGAALRQESRHPGIFVLLQTESTNEHALMCCLTGATSVPPTILVGFLTPHLQKVGAAVAAVVAVVVGAAVVVVAPVVVVVAAVMPVSSSNFS